MLSPGTVPGFDNASSRDTSRKAHFFLCLTVYTRKRERTDERIKKISLRTMHFHDDSLEGTVHRTCQRAPKSLSGRYSANMKPYRGEVVSAFLREHVGARRQQHRLLQSHCISRYRCLLLAMLLLLFVGQGHWIAYTQKTIRIEDR